MFLNKNKLNKIKIQFDNYGFVHLKSFFKKKKIEIIKKNLFLFLKKNKENFHKREIHHAKGSKLINSVHHLKWPYVKTLKKDKKIIKIIKYLFQDKIKDFGAEVFAKPAKFGMAVPIHQDNFYWNVDNEKGVTVWIALDNSNKKNGALFYYKKSHKAGLQVHKPSFIPGSSQVLKNKNILKKYKKITPYLDTGDILIHHCLIIHGSDRNRSNKSRSGLTLRYISKSSKINKTAKKKYEKILKKQLSQKF